MLKYTLVFEDGSKVGGIYVDNILKPGMRLDILESKEVEVLAEISADTVLVKYVG